MSRVRTYLDCRVAALLACAIAVVSPALGQVTLKPAANELIIETESSKAVLRGAALVSYVNRHTNQEYVAQQGADWISLNRMEPVNQPLKPGKWQVIREEATGATYGDIIYSDESRTVRLRAGIDASTDEIYIRLAGLSTPGVQSVFWGIFGFDLTNGKLVLPGQAGTWYGKNSIPNIVGLDYPVHWESQFLIYEHVKGSLLIYAHDTKPHFKRLHGSRESGTLDFGFEVFAVAPWESATDVPEIDWRFKAFPEGWKEPSAYYKAWWKRVGPQAPSEPDPEWAKDVNVVISVLYLDIPTLEFMARMVDAKKTLLYLTDWRKDPFDINYPDYRWREETKKYIDRAREFGFRIMLHMNLLGVNEINEHYPAMERYQLRTANDRQQIGWLWDLEPRHMRRLAYINPAAPEYRKLFIDSIRVAVEGLKPDAIHLDAGGAILNDGNGLINGKNSIEGLMEMHAELRAAYPDLLFGYESLSEVNAPFLRYAQRWSSITPPHPVSTFLNDKVLSFGFLDQPHADENEFTSYLKRYEGQGILPTAPVASMDDFDETRPRTYRLFDLFREWQKHQFRPDWDTDWNGDIFRYRSRDGNTVARVEDKDNFIRLYIGDEVFYERIHKANAVATPSYVRDWPAFQQDRLIGLDPDEQYWIEPKSQRPNEIPTITGLPEGVMVGKNTFTTPEFGLFTLQRPSPESYDFATAFWRATTGTMFTSPLRERPIVAGALVRMNPVLVGGKVRSPALLMHPPYQGILGGVTFTEFDVPVPQANKVQFEFDVAIADVPRREPATFVVWLNGSEVWRKYVGTGAWEHGVIDLTAHAGKTIKLRLISGPGQRNDPRLAYTCWSDLRIVSNPDRPGSEVQLNTPQGLTAVSDGVEVEPGDNKNTWRVKLDVPGTFVAFAVPPPKAEIGKSLFDYAYTSSRRAFNSLPSPYKSTWNALVQSVHDGQNERKLLFAQPPRNGRIYMNWTLQLPANIQAIDFEYGLMEPAPEYRHLNIQYSGAEYFVYINGEEVFKGESRSSTPVSARVDLSKWAGKPVLIQFAVDASGSAIFDWCFFSRMMLQ